MGGFRIEVGLVILLDVRPIKGECSEFHRTTFSRTDDWHPDGDDFDVVEDDDDDDDYDDNDVDVGVDDGDVN